MTVRAGGCSIVVKPKKFDFVRQTVCQTVSHQTVSHQEVHVGWTQGYMLHVHMYM